LIQGEKGMMVGLSCHNIISTPFEDVVKGAKRPDDDMMRMAEILGI
jgi:6-phosphofructokinase 1